MVYILTQDLNPSKQTFNKFQNIIESLTQNYNNINHAFVKRGLNVTLKNNKLSITSGLGYSKNGKKLLLSDNYELDLGKKSSLYVYLEHITIKSNKLLVKDRNNKIIYNGYKFELDSAIPRILELDFIPENPYASSICFQDDILVLGFLQNDKFSKLNTLNQINNFKAGTVLLYSGDEFRDFITLENFKKASTYYQKYLKFSSKFGIVHTKEFKLAPDHLPVLNFSGKTDYTGRHRHAYRRNDSRTGGNWENKPYWWGSQLDWLENAGEHTHKFSASFLNEAQAPIKSSPSYFSLIPIIRV